jgi:hypothetical protein
MRRLRGQSVTVATRDGSAGEHLNVDQALFTTLWMTCRNIQHEETRASIGEHLPLCILVYQQVMEGKQQVGLVLCWYPHCLESRQRRDLPSWRQTLLDGCGVGDEAEQ